MGMHVTAGGACWNYYWNYGSSTMTMRTAMQREVVLGTAGRVGPGVLVLAM
jgi:hypothetical protein